eukprot:7871379-Alexandrium_andersonii.AAC.1
MPSVSGRGLACLTGRSIAQGHSCCVCASRRAGWTCRRGAMGARDGLDLRGVVLQPPAPRARSLE